jgi:FkbM family methyltransferase
MRFLKLIRRIGLINKLLRWVLRELVVNLPVFFKSKVVARWRIVGEVELNVDETNFKYYSNGDDNTVDALYYDLKGYTEKTELMLFLSFARQSKVILDVGANTGLYSVASSIANPKTTIYAFEPYSVNANRLQINLRLNRIQNVVVIKDVVGDSCKEVKFTVPENDMVCDVLSANSEFTKKFYTEWLKYKEINKHQITLDAFVEESNLMDVDLIKIDVESYELEVLRGAESLLKNNCPVIFCEMFVDNLRSDFYQNFMRGLGYFCYAILDSGLIRLEELIPNPDCRNFIFSKNKSSRQYLSYKDMNIIINELKSQH